VIEHLHHVDGVGPAGLELNDCAVQEVRRAGPWTVIWLDAPEVARGARPGQFVMVGVPAPGFHLRRPLSIHRRREGAIALLVETRGEGTGLLAASEPGRRLQISGSLGRGFPTQGIGHALLVGGGIGLAPLQFLADEFAAAGIPALSYAGVRGAGQLALLDLFRLPGLEIATEDGSRGTAGTVVDALRASAAAPVAAGHGAVVFACGPTPMLVAVRDWAAGYGARGYASLEAHMACGTGACHGCVVPTSSGEYARVCADGPVLPLEQVTAP
jgi:dihydroorotate dehydrogenase electron transfer subunit